MTALQILQMVSLALTLAESAGVNIVKLQQARATAKHQGRELTDEELQVFANDAQDAIDRLIRGNNA